MTPETVRRHGTRDAVIGAVLFAALLVLAVLQYRWIGQVSEADSNRLKNELRTTLSRFTNDFDTEIERLARVLSSVSPQETGSDQEIMDRRLELWRDLALHPPLVKKVWLADAPDLPVELKRLADRLPKDLSNLRGGRGGRFPTMVDSAVPAFALLRLTAQSTSTPDQLKWLIVQLDQDYVKKEWLPDLVSKNFGPEFHVRIVRGTNRETIFETEPKLEKPPEDEASEPLFGFRGSFGRGRGSGKGSPSGGPGIGPGVGPNDWFKGFPSSEPGKRPNETRSAAPSTPSRDSVPFRGDGGPPDLGWRAEVSFQSGTTAELVASLRARNLAVSFGILLLMGVSIAMLMLSTRRANVLATQQMEFVAGVTHELRTPLAVILSASQNLADGVTVEENRVRRYGGVIHSQTKRLSGMVEQVLRFAGLSSQHGEIQCAPVDVAQLVHEAVTDCRLEFESAGAHLSLDVGADLPPINGDRGALLHALRNLLSNAAKHGGGANVRLRAAEAQGRIEIVVEDDGPGVEPDDLPHLFEPFFRGQRAKQEQVHGSGLGLSLVKKIVDAHHGTIEAASRPGHGIAFRMLLPAAKVG